MKKIIYTERGNAVNYHAKNIEKALFNRQEAVLKYRKRLFI